MSNCTRYLGLDVHAETITAAIAEGRGRIRSLGKFPNRPEAVRKLTEKLGGAKNLKVCYEAGPTDPRCRVRGSSRRMKDCEVRRYDKPSNISLITVDKACPRPLTLRFISIADGGKS